MDLKDCMVFLNEMFEQRKCEGLTKFIDLYKELVQHKHSQLWLYSPRPLWPAVGIFLRTYVVYL